MMAVICSCLRPRAKIRAAAIRQLGSYIWVPPPENPQGLGYFTFATGSLAREKWPGRGEFRWKTGTWAQDGKEVVVRKNPTSPSPKNPVKVPATPGRVPNPSGLHGLAIPIQLRKKSG